MIFTGRNNSPVGRPLPVHNRLAGPPSGTPNSKAGQSILESCFAICLICLVFTGIFQISQIYAAREILCHASARAARAKTVGFNHWMVEKVARVASIPNAGPIITPIIDPDLGIQRVTQDHLFPASGQRTPGLFWMRVLRGNLRQPSTQVDIEIASMPQYLWSPDSHTAKHVLDYKDWDRVKMDDLTDSSGDIAKIKVSQRYPLKIRAHRTFYASDDINISIDSSLENHYPLYLDDEGW
ncbi:MAG: pilus assembly protein [Kiritimatiellae bacterium]|nr:pilus assembly protein [Kiritimatiellia bacterium]